MEGHELTSETGESDLSELTKFSTTQILRDGRQVEIRAQRPEDGEGLKAAVARMSSTALYRRFFAVRREFSDKEVSDFVDIDFVSQVALVVVATEGGAPKIVGAGRYIVLNARQAEVAFAILDDYQGQGIGSALMRRLSAIARTAGLKELIAEVLAKNVSMLKVFQKCGLAMRTELEQGVIHVTLHLA